MKVVHVVRQFAPAVGGLEEAVLKLCLALKRAGIDIEVVTLDRIFGGNGERLPASATVSGLRVRRVPFRGSTRYPIAPGVLSRLGSADLVHVHAIDFFFDFIAATRLVHRKPLIASTHGGFFHTEFAQRLKRAYFSTVTRASCRAYGAICASSENDAQVFSTIAPDRVVTAENGVDIEKWAGRASPEWRRSLLYIGRFSGNKRPELLIPVLRELRALDSDWRLTYAGRPWDVTAEQLLALAREHGVADAVEIVVEPSDDEIARRIGSASYFVSPSAYEGFGLSAVEGMSAGLVPLLSPIPTFAKLLRETACGRLIGFDDPKADAAHIEQWHAEGAADSARLRAASIAGAARYGWDEAAARFREQYERILGRRN